MPSSRPAARRVPLRAALLVDAPEPAVGHAARSAATWWRAATAVGTGMAIAGHRQPDGVLRPGMVVRLGRRGRGALYRVAAPAVDDSSEVIRLDGIGATAGRRVSVTAAPTRAGSLVTAEVDGGPRLGRVRTLRALQTLLGVIGLVATTDTDSSPPTAEHQPGSAVRNGDGRAADVPAERIEADHRNERSVVVAGVLIRGGAVLAARRTHPPDLAGFWECPGGKVEPGESETTALVREFEEELGIAVRPGDRIGPDLEVGHGYVLHAYRVELISGEPSPTVHDAVRWVGADEIAALRWLPTDRPLIAALRDALGRPGTVTTGAPSPP